jgi:hypothetical protein
VPSLGESSALSKAKLETFDLDDLERVLSDQDKLVMAETILAWADLDTGISRLIFLIFGISEDGGSILIGNMDLKTKAERIKMLYDHAGNERGSASFNRLINAMKKHSFSRNAIAHRKCIGKLISKPTMLVFMSSKHVKGQANQFEMLCIDHSEIVGSAKFAREAAVKIGDMIIAIEDRRKNLADRQA